MTTPQAIMPLNVDSTMLTCFRSCPEKFRLEFIYGLRPAGISVDLHAGGAFATALETVRKEVYQKGRSLDDAMIAASAAFHIAWGSFEIPEYKKTSKTRERVLEAVEQYFLHWSPLTDHFQPYFIDGKPTFEFSFAIPLEPAATNTINAKLYASYDPDHHPGQFPLHPAGDPWLYSGRFDMLGSYEGRPAFGDEKTTGTSISTGWAEKWRLRNQFLGYTRACRQAGLDVLGGVVRGVSILKTMINFAEATPMYSQHLIDLWYEQLRRDLWRMRQAWDSGYFDLNLADTCTSYGNCMFMNICAATPEQKLNWYNDFEVRRWNPLVKNPIEEAKDAA